MANKQHSKAPLVKNAAAGDTWILTANDILTKMISQDNQGKAKGKANLIDQHATKMITHKNLSVTTAANNTFTPI